VKVSFNRTPPSGPWGGGASFVDNMSKFLISAGHDVIFHLERDVDVIFMIDPRHSDGGYSINEIAHYKSLFPGTKIIHRINECDKRKGTSFIDSLLLSSNEIADETVFISKWLQKYFKESGFSKESHVVYNGCDSNFFFKKNNSNINDKLKVITHHWSDNWMKGFDIYSKIDQYLDNHDDFEFTYVGRYSKEYTPSNTRIVSPLSGMKLGEEIRKHDIYVTASRFEPCGMHHVEGSSCGLPVLFHEDGGGINELCINHGEQFKNFEEFLSCLDKVKNEYSSYVDKIDSSFLTSDRCCGEYEEIILNLLGGSENNERI